MLSIEITIGEGDLNLTEQGMEQMDTVLVPNPNADVQNVVVIDAESVEQAINSIEQILSPESVVVTPGNANILTVTEEEKMALAVRITNAAVPDFPEPARRVIATTLFTRMGDLLATILDATKSIATKAAVL